MPKMNIKNQNIEVFNQIS